jgi:hypothetical protein
MRMHVKRGLGVVVILIYLLFNIFTVVYSI